ncbi:MAG: hypothetical protein R3B06_11915 [Kofleriaceae bacterium]
MALAELTIVHERKGDERGLGARLYAGVPSRPFAACALGARAFTAIGASMARLRLWAPRAGLPESTAGSHVTYQLEARLGLRWPAGHYAFIAGGPIVSMVTPHSRAASATLESIGYRHGARATIGAVINHGLVQVTWEHVDGVDRFGVALGAAL